MSLAMEMRLEEKLVVKQAVILGGCPDSASTATEVKNKEEITTERFDTSFWNKNVKETTALTATIKCARGTISQLSNLQWIFLKTITDRCTMEKMMSNNRCNFLEDSAKTMTAAASIFNQKTTAA